MFSHSARVEEWGMEEVGRWVEEMGLQYAPLFKANEVDGKRLLSLTVPQLYRDLGINTHAHIVRIVQGIEDLRATAGGEEMEEEPYQEEFRAPPPAPPANVESREGKVSERRGKKSKKGKKSVSEEAVEQGPQEATDPTNPELPAGRLLAKTSKKKSQRNQEKSGVTDAAKEMKEESEEEKGRVKAMLEKLENKLNSEVSRAAPFSAESPPLEDKAIPQPPFLPPQRTHARKPGNRRAVQTERPAPTPLTSRGETQQRKPRVPTRAESVPALSLGGERLSRRSSGFLKASFREGVDSCFGVARPSDSLKGSFSKASTPRWIAMSVNASEHIGVPGPQSYQKVEEFGRKPFTPRQEPRGFSFSRAPRSSSSQPSLASEGRGAGAGPLGPGAYKTELSALKRSFPNTFPRSQRFSAGDFSSILSSRGKDSPGPGAYGGAAFSSVGSSSKYAPPPVRVKMKGGVIPRGPRSTMVKKDAASTPGPSSYAPKHASLSTFK